VFSCATTLSCPRAAEPSREGTRAANTRIEDGEPVAEGEVGMARGEDDAIRVAVSTVIFSLRTAPEGDRLMLPLVRRTREPHLGRWALPGGWLDPAEDLD